MQKPDLNIEEMRLRDASMFSPVYVSVAANVCIMNDGASEVSETQPHVPLSTI